MITIVKWSLKNYSSFILENDIRWSDTRLSKSRYFLSPFNNVFLIIFTKRLLYCLNNLPEIDNCLNNMPEAWFLPLLYTFISHYCPSVDSVCKSYVSAEKPLAFILINFLSLHFVIPIFFLLTRNISFRLFSAIVSTDWELYFSK